MNKLLLLFFVFLGTVAFAQTDQEIEQIADETCKCLKGKTKQLKEASTDELQMELGLCMIGATNSLGIEINLSDPAGLESLGERVGFQMAFSCPDFMEMIGQMMNEDPELMEDIMEDDEDFSFVSSQSSGTALEVMSGDFVSLKIESDSGKKETYYWLEHFNGAELLENGGAAIRGKEVVLSYYKMEVYSPKLEDYIQIRILRSLSVD